MDALFGQELDMFLRHINSLRDSLPLSMLMIDAKLHTNRKQLDKYIKDKEIPKTKNEDGEETYTVKFDDLVGFNDRKKKVESLSIASKLIPRNYIVSLVSYFDVLIAGLVRAIYQECPESFNNSEKTVNYSQLNEFGSVKEAKNYIVEKEIESQLRSSHSEQVKWFENKLNIQLKKNMPIWKGFIEVTERRNLFVHNNGIVTRSYLDNCLITIRNAIRTGYSLAISKQGKTMNYLSLAHSVCFLYY